MIARITIFGVSFTASTTGDVGINTGRPRYRVICDECGEVVHEATTGPYELAELHVRRMLEKSEH